MLLYKHIYYDAEMIEKIKKGEYPNWEITYEDEIICKVKEISK